MVSQVVDTPLDASVVDAYGLHAPGPAKRGQARLRNPRDISQVLSAAKKKRRAHDTSEAKRLGPDPAGRQRAEGQRTGLRNLGATCYMNSLLQTLHMTRGFRRGIYSWQPPPTAEEPAAAAAAAATAAATATAATTADGGGAAAGGKSAQEVANAVVSSLQHLFASLQHSSLACYDPARLTEALSLDTGVQQDAQEFNKLLLTFLEEQLQLSPAPELQRLVPSLFRGHSCYSTVCVRCSRPSESSSTRYPFYELELNVRPTLHAALEEYVQTEHLEGVECAHCAAKHDATRAIELLEIPPVLTLQLLRFVYDLETFQKKKVTSAITFPEVLDLAPYTRAGRAHAGGANGGDGGGMRYRLTAVLMHTGSSAHSGHYTARIMEQPGGGEQGEQSPDAPAAAAGGGAGAPLDAARWWTFNDETVTLEDWESDKERGGAGVALVVGGGGAASGVAVDGAAGGKPKGKKGKQRAAKAEAPAEAPAEAAPADGSEAAGAGAAGAGASFGPRTFTSKTAYMLCYTRESTLLGELSSAAPLEAPECLRAPIDEENAKLQAEVEAHAAAAASLQEGRAARDALCEELEPLLGQPAAAGDGRWVSEQSLERCLTLPPSEAGGIDNAPLVCEHGKASPQALGKMRLVSSDAWAVLCRRVGGGPELRDHGCLACVGVQSQEQQRRDNLKSVLAVAFGGGGGGGGGFYLPRALEKRWSKLLDSGEHDVTSTLLCEHRQLSNADEAVCVDAATWDAVQASFPASPALAATAVSQCTACLDARRLATEGSKAEKQERAQKRVRLKRLLDDEPLTLLDVLDSRDVDDDGGGGGGGGGATARRAAATLYLIDAAWLERWREAMRKPARVASELDAPTAASLLCTHGKLQVPPTLSRSWQQLVSACGGGGAAAGGGARGVDGARDAKLGEAACLITAAEARELAGGPRGGPPTGLAACTYTHGGDGTLLGTLQPQLGLCEECAATAAAAALAAVTSFECEPIYIQRIDKAAAQALCAAAAGTDRHDGGAAADSPAAGATGGAPPSGAAAAGSRRSRRSGGGAAVTVRAASSITINNLKLLIFQASEDDVPSQQRLFFDGAELQDDDATLEDVGVVPHSRVQLFLDQGRPADTQAAWDAHSRQTAEERQGKPRKPEDGFVGSALLTSSFGTTPSGSAAERAV